MNKNTILAIVFLMAGTLLTIGVTSMVPAVYADDDDDKHDKDDHDKKDDGKDGEGNKNSAEDGSQAALADCDDNHVEEAGFDCVAVAESSEEENNG